MQISAEVTRAKGSPFMRGGTRQILPYRRSHTVWIIRGVHCQGYESWSVAGLVRQPSSSALAGIAPSNTYPCQDGSYVVIGGNGDAIFKRLLRLIQLPELADAIHAIVPTKSVLKTQLNSTP